MLATPDYSHFKTQDYETFYEPSEDTFLFLDALELDINFLNNLKPLVIVEIGSGSGLVINFLAKNLKNNAIYMSTDFNSNACLATQKTSIQNKNDFIDQINCDLIGPIQSRLEKSIDVLLFNPPYVVTESNELGFGDLRAAWAGGKKGREVMDRLFPLIDFILSPTGVFYLVCIKPNQIDEIEKLLSGFKMTILMNRKAGIENLFVLKFTREIK
jgi:release factor glutamine methyltransferase